MYTFIIIYIILFYDTTGLVAMGFFVFWDTALGPKAIITIFTCLRDRLCVYYYYRVRHVKSQPIIIYIYTHQKTRIPATADGEMCAIVFRGRARNRYHGIQINYAYTSNTAPPGAPDRIFFL